MLSTQYIALAEQLLPKLSAPEALLDLRQQLYEIRQPLGDVLKLAQDAQSWFLKEATEENQNEASTLPYRIPDREFEKQFSRLAYVMSALDKVRVRRVIAATRDIERDVLEFLNAIGYEAKPDKSLDPRYAAGDLIFQLHIFDDSFEEFATSKQDNERYVAFLDLTERLGGVFSALDSTRAILTATVQILKGAPAMHDGEDILTVRLGSIYTLGETAKKLEALDALYTELCFVLSISETDFPLRVSKIETGSLVTEILGSAKVIELLASLITGSARYLHRRFAREGKIATIPQGVEAIESVVQLREKLTALGINTIDVDENIRIASVKLSKKLNILLADEPQVVVNGQESTVGEQYQNQYLEAKARLSLAAPAAVEFDENQNSNAQQDLTR